MLTGRKLTLRRTATGADVTTGASNRSMVDQQSRLQWYPKARFLGTVEGDHIKEEVIILISGIKGRGGKGRKPERNKMDHRRLHIFPRVQRKNAALQIPCILLNLRLIAKERGRNPRGDDEYSALDRGQLYLDACRNPRSPMAPPSCPRSPESLARGAESRGTPAIQRHQMSSVFPCCW